MMWRPFNRTPRGHFNEFLILIFYPLLKQSYKWVAQRALLSNQVFVRLPHESFFFFPVTKQVAALEGSLKKIPVIMSYLSCLHIADSTAISIQRKTRKEIKYKLKANKPEKCNKITILCLSENDFLSMHALNENL